MVNHRVICDFCKNSVLSRDIGKHILTNHESLLFTGHNLKVLHRDKSLTKPILLTTETSSAYYCLADNSCIKKETLADQHFRGKAEEHQRRVKALREAYPLDGSGSPSEPETAPLGLPSSDQKVLQEWFAYVVTNFKDVDIDRKVRRALEKLSITVETEVLQEKFPHLFEEEKPQAPPLETPEDDLLPLVEEKPVTKEELLKQAFSDPKFVDEISRGVVSGVAQAIPELEALKKVASSEPPQPPLKRRGVKAVQSEAIPLPRPTPPPPQPQPQVAAPVSESVVSEMQSFAKMTPWERFLRSNPTLSVQEQLQVAQAMGIRPDETSGFKIVQNSKVKRTIKS